MAKRKPIEGIVDPLDALRRMKPEAQRKFIENLIEKLLEKIDTLTAERDAALARVGVLEGALKVRPLQWTDDVAGSWAPSPFGRFVICDERGRRVGFTARLVLGSFQREGFTDAASAKAAVDEFWSETILAALSPAPTVKGEEQ